MNEEKIKLILEEIHKGLHDVAHFLAKLEQVHKQYVAEQEKILQRILVCDNEIRTNMEWIEKLMEKRGGE